MLKSWLTGLSLGLSLAFSTVDPAASVPLEKVSQQKLPPQLGIEQQWDDRDALLNAINHSLRYLQQDSAQKDYQDYPIDDITRDRVYRSLIRFRQLVKSSSSPEELAEAVKKEFAFYRSVGKDEQGTVHFTAYFEPVYQASRTRQGQYQYPIYQLPPNFEEWSSPHPTRQELEGIDGKGKNSPLAGYEIAWLRDRLEAYLIHVQGSAQLELRNGERMTVNFAGKTDQPYTSIGKELVEDGKLTRENLSLPRLIHYFENHPDQLKNYLPRNQSFVFFEQTDGQPPEGNLGIPVTADRAIATDQSQMPPGALALIRTQFPKINNNQEVETPLVSRYMLNQDTGSAIKGPGRVDMFLGTGETAARRAGIVDWTGELYYLLLKE